MNINIPHIDLTDSIAGIIRSDYRTADVFNRYDISFCRDGKLTISQVCRERKIESGQLLADLQRVTRNVLLSNHIQFSSWDVGFLVDYILNVHHAYLHRIMPLLGSGLRNVCQSHNNQYPELSNILDIYEDAEVLINALLRHVEEIIFPYIKQIENAHRRKESYALLFVRTLRKPLHNIETEHRRIRNVLNDLRMQTNYFQLPAETCTQQHVVFSRLREWDADLEQHAWLENQALFPKAILMEKELLQL